jgi:hypothetical protein
MILEVETQTMAKPDKKTRKAIDRLLSLGYAVKAPRS